MNGIRLTKHGQLHGTFKTPQGKWMMSVRTDEGEWIEVPHDGVIPPPTMNTKRKKK